MRIVSRWGGACALGAVSGLGLVLGFAPGSPGDVLQAANAGPPIEEQIVLATFGSPAIPRIAYSTAGNNGTFGFVFDVVSAGRPFALTAIQRPTGLEDFDIAFYSSLDATDPIESFGSAGDETGTIPIGSKFGIVTMSAGANGTFLYTWS